MNEGNEWSKCKWKDQILTVEMRRRGMIPDELLTASMKSQNVLLTRPSVVQTVKCSVESPPRQPHPPRATVTRPLYDTIATPGCECRPEALRDITDEAMTEGKIKQRMFQMMMKNVMKLT